MHFKFLTIAALALTTIVSQAQAAQVCHYRNVMPEYFAFAATSASLPPAKRADLFIRDFMPRHPTFYDADVFKDTAKSNKLHEYAQGLFDRAKPETIPGFPSLNQARFRAVANTIETEFAASQVKLLKTFPDFKCQTEIEFGPSMLAFDGHSYDDAHKQSHLLFGVDTISLIHGPDDMSAFFTHELFHVYHAQVMGSLVPKGDGVVWWSMWEEGLATYMSKALNEPLSEQRVLGFPVDMVARMQKPGATAQAARLMLTDFDSSTRYAYWFEANKAVPGLPPRAGYYLGLKLVESVARDHSLQWLAHLKPDDVKSLSRDFLEEKSASR